MISLKIFNQKNKLTPHRKRGTHDPCPGCFLYKERCICAFAPKLDLVTKVTLIIHTYELRHTTNTGRLALNSLINSEMRIRGEGRETLDLSDLLTPDYRSLLFFPTPDAVELNADFLAQDSRPIQLLVPDGNWAQASKVYRRHRELDVLPRVKLSLGEQKTNLFMRLPPKKHDMATLEAIAHALGIIEGEEVRNQLLDYYQRKLEATIRGRGAVHLLKG